MRKKLNVCYYYEKKDNCKLRKTFGSSIFPSL